jgi:PPOX class probable F420-dependent enzyme
VNSLSEAEHQLLSDCRRAVLATTAADGRPQLVPIAYASAIDDAGGVLLYSALDEKPKTVDDPRSLARVRNILARPRVSVLVDRWSEDWTELCWLRLDGTAKLLEPADGGGAEHGRAVALLRERYPQYATHRLEARPILRISVERAVSWGLEG